MKSYEDLQNRIEILKDDKRVFIEECNQLRKENIRLKSAVVAKPLLCDVRELLQMIDEIPCNCIEAYKSRGLSDPDCPRCNYVDDDIVGKVRAHFA